MARSSSSPRSSLAAITALALAGGIVVLPACVSDPPPDTVANPCDEYCDAVTANCTGDLAPYVDRAQCSKACALMDRGAEQDGANTIGCRLAHARIGKSASECSKASAFGGGACGDTCATFCALVDKQCIQAPIANKPYGDVGACIETCNDPDPLLAYQPGGIDGRTASGETLNCRMYHLLLSFGAQEVHCPHTAKASDTCK